MRRIAIVGAGQAGLPLAIGLLKGGYQVTLVADRTPEEILRGRATGTTALLGEWSIGFEERLGLAYWRDRAPALTGIRLTVGDAGGGPALALSGRFQRPAMAVDQRLKFSTWATEFMQRGGDYQVRSATVDDLERLAGDADLTVVAVGRAELSGLFARDDARSTHTRPRRKLIQFYVDGLQGWEATDPTLVRLSIVPGAAEIFWIPFLANTGATCHSIMIEAEPGGPLDVFDGISDPEGLLDRMQATIETVVPWESDNVRAVRLIRGQATLRGAVVPVVRHPIGRLPSGRAVLGLADTVILNDPLAGQGGNSANRMADVLLRRITEREARPFDEAWMHAAFAEMWSYAQYVVAFSNGLLEPLQPFQTAILAAAARNPQIGADFVHMFEDPRSAVPWFVDADAARRYLEAHGGAPATAA